MKKTTILLFAVLFAGGGGCSRTDHATVNHVVVIWLKQPGNQEHRTRIIEETEKLKSIPGVTSVKVGPCIESERSIVDSSFDVAITMTFRSVEAMNAYIEHPAHDKMVKTKLMPIVEKIRVFDFLSSPG